jgi:acylphosphatase
MNLVVRHLSISGRVQGVGYRATLQHEALRLGLRGWVRNRLDGSVEAVVAGHMTAVETLIAWSQRGPAAARVLAVQVSPLADDPAFDGFEQRPTV